LICDNQLKPGAGFLNLYTLLGPTSPLTQTAGDFGKGREMRQCIAPAPTPLPPPPLQPSLSLSSSLTLSPDLPPPTPPHPTVPLL
jgi:hypothetical protein